MKNLLLVLIILVSTSGFSQHVEWVSAFGDNLKENGESITFDNNSNLIVAGYFEDTVTFGSSTFISRGSRDILVIKFDSSGNLIWAKNAGSTAEDAGLNIAADANGNVYVGGYFKGTCTFESSTYSCAGGKDIFLAKYNPSGTLQWVKTAGGIGDDESKGVSVDQNGNVWCTGQFQSITTFGPSQTLTSSGSSDTYVVTYSPTGTILNLFKGGGVNTCWPSGIDNDMFNNAYITGAYVGNVSFGTLSLTGGTDYNFFVAKSDLNGNWIWVKTAPGSQNDYGNGIAVDDSGYVSVTGSFFDTLFFNNFNVISNGSKDGFVAKYNSNGNVLWGMTLGGISSDKGIEVAVDNTKSTFITGFANGPSSIGTHALSPIGGDDIIVARIYHGGYVNWHTTYGSTGQDYGMGIDVLNNGKVAITGNFSSTATFDSISKTSAGDRDFYALLINESPYIFLHPPDTSVCEGADFTIATSSRMANPFTTVWQHNGVDIPNSNHCSLIFYDVDLSDSGEYRAIVTNQYGVDTSDICYLTVNPLPPTENLGGDTAFCEGGVKTLMATPGYSKYYWSSNIGSQSLQVMQTDTVNLIVEDSNGCQSAPDTVIITVYPIPVVNLGSDAMICSDTQLFLDAGSGYATYLWSDNYSGQSRFINQTDTLWAMVKEGLNNCWSIADTIIVEVLQIPSIDIGNDTILCNGNTVVLDAGPNFKNYYWSDNSTIRTNVVTTSQQLSVYVKDFHDCLSKADTIQISFLTLPVLNFGNDTSLCWGDSVVLDAGSGFADYYWSNSFHGSMQPIYNSDTITARIQDSVNGCWSEDESIIITVYALPVYSLGSDDSICEGTNKTLYVSTFYQNYIWSNGFQGNTMQVEQSDTISLIVQDPVTSCWSLPETIIITVIPAPRINLGVDSALCDGDSLILSLPQAYAQYNWSDSKTVPDRIIYEAKTLWLKVKDTNNCWGPSDTIVVTFNPLPVLSLQIDTSFCEGEYVITDAGPGFIEYHWSDGYTQQSRTIDKTSVLGIYIIDSNYCKSNEDTVRIMVHPLPNPDLGIDLKIPLNDTIVLNPGFFQSYYWNDGSDNSELLIIASEKDTGYFVFWVEVSDSNGCLSSDTIVVQVYDNTSIEESTIGLFKIFPNPARDKIFVTHEGIDKILHMEINDLSGKIVKTHVVANESFDYNISNLPSGTYFIKIFSQDQKVNFTKKFIISR